MRYFITFTCHGTHVHGDESDIVDQHHNVFGTPFAEASPQRRGMKLEQMDQGPYFMDQGRRAVVLDALQEVCLHRGWILLAAHVRTNHVHIVVEGDIRPEMMLNTFKSYASRGLNRTGIDEPDRKRWARHGSTRWLFKDLDVQEAIRYFVSGQGESMEVFLAEWP
jgi:REP element-mobilizing transposase RayT